MWDIQLAQLGAYISLLRYNYTKKLDMFAKSFMRIYQRAEKGWSLDIIPLCIQIWRAEKIMQEKWLKSI